MRTSVVRREKGAGMQEITLASFHAALREGQEVKVAADRLPDKFPLLPSFSSSQTTPITYYSDSHEQDALPGYRFFVTTQSISRSKWRGFQPPPDCNVGKPTASVMRILT